MAQSGATAAAPTRLALLAGAVLTVMSGATLAPALPRMRVVFAATEGADWLVPLVMTTPALFIALSAPFAGALGDRVGRRRFLLASLVLYGVAGTAGLFASSLVSLLAGRALLGAATAGVMTASTALAAELFAGLDRARFFGQQAAAMSLGGVVSVFSGGILASVHWRAPFVVYALALPLALAVRIAVARTPSSRERRAESAPALGPAAREHHAARVLVNALAVCGMAFYFMVHLRAPFLLTAYGAGPALSGAAVAGTTLFGAFASLSFGKLSSRRPPGLSWLAVSFTVMAAGYLAVGAASSMPVTLAGLALAGVGAGWIMPNLSSWLMSITTDRGRGAAVGALTSSVYAGQFASSLLAHLPGAGTSVAASFRLAGALLVLVAAACAVGVRVRR